jgi:hypothetical protein
VHSTRRARCWHQKRFGLQVDVGHRVAAIIRLFARHCRTTFRAGISGSPSEFPAPVLCDDVHHLPPHVISEIFSQNLPRTAKHHLGASVPTGPAPQRDGAGQILDERVVVAEQLHPQILPCRQLLGVYQPDRLHDSVMHQAARARHPASRRGCPSRPALGGDRIEAEPSRTVRRGEVAVAGGAVKQVEASRQLLPENLAVLYHAFPLEISEAYYPLFIIATSRTSKSMSCQESCSDWRRR